METVRRLQEEYKISDADIRKPGFYSFDHVTGQPTLRRTVETHK